MTFLKALPTTLPTMFGPRTRITYGLHGDSNHQHVENKMAAEFCKLNTVSLTGRILPIRHLRELPLSWTPPVCGELLKINYMASYAHT